MISEYYKYRVDKLINAIGNYTTYKLYYGEDNKETIRFKLNVCIEDLKLRIFKAIFGRWINE